MRNESAEPGRFAPKQLSLICTRGGSVLVNDSQTPSTHFCSKREGNLWTMAQENPHEAEWTWLHNSAQKWWTRSTFQPKKPSYPSVGNQQWEGGKKRSSKGVEGDYENLFSWHLQGKGGRHCHWKMKRVAGSTLTVSHEHGVHCQLSPNTLCDLCYLLFDM